MHPFLEGQKFIAFAHRGGGDEAAENTLEAFQYSIDLGYRYIETDVQATSDGVVVVFHDYDLLRLTGVEGKIADYTWAELQKFQVHGKGAIPRFDEVLRTWPEVRFNVDAKVDDVVQPLCKLAKTDNLDRLCLASEYEVRVKHVREEMGRNLCTAASRGEVVRFLLPAKVGMKPPEIDAHCLQIPPKAFGLSTLTRATLGRAFEMDKPVHVWTIDTAEEMALLVDKGVGGIMTDRPKVLKSVLESLHVW